MKRNDFISNVKRKINRLLSPPEKTYIGIDFGGGRHDPTCLCIIKNSGESRHIIFKNIESTSFADQVHSIADMIHETSPLSVVIDGGYSQVQSQMLQREFGELVKTCFYVANRTTRFSYNSDTWQLSVDRDAFMAESQRLSPRTLQGNERHALNYAYIASIIGAGSENTRSFV